MWTGLFEAKRDIGQFKETRTTGNAADAIFPCAFARRSFQTVALSDPQLLGVVVRLGNFPFLCHRKRYLVVTVADARVAFWSEDADHLCKQVGGTLGGVNRVIDACDRRFSWTMECEQGGGATPAQFSYEQSPALQGDAVSNDNEPKLFPGAKLDSLINGSYGRNLKANAGEEHLASRRQVRVIAYGEDPRGRCIAVRRWIYGSLGAF